MFFGTKPLDWLMLVVEILVLGLISYEVIVGEQRHRRDRKQQRRMLEIGGALSDLMERGEELLMRVPCPTLAQGLEVDLWQVDAQAWSKETSEFLASLSLRALAAFRLVPGTGVMGQVVYVASGASFTIDGPVRHSYERLVAQLENLRGIMEKLDSYL